MLFERKKSEHVKLKKFERKIKSVFIIDADFKSILVPEDNPKLNRNECSQISAICCFQLSL